MRRQGGHCEVNSSIALLQERFRNLQKPRSWFSHPELVRPSRPAVQRAVADETTVQPPAVSVGRAAVVLQSSGWRSDVEVDTSLHL
ncbi:hypothetical protein E2562_003173 [Oryza meyeriana var. granulata]|uniref:Uncharacterized protein n=1 Tax=Oryza meyeriana var. granulata TaxID=110450 RepID=A0A6G1EUQ8_9ORYZ|nr:hypothetical protein E2562_003173 [Oryza meyeriana var. granulata]